MVWATSPALTLATAGLRLVRALIPLAMLWVGKLILDELVAFTTAGTGDVSLIWTLVALELALAVLSDLSARVNTLTESLLADRFTNRVSVRLIEHATTLDLASFEDPVFYDKLERARRQTTGRLGLLAALLNLSQDAISLISLSAALIVFSPWLMVLLVLAVLPAFLGETHFSSLAYSVLYRRTPQRRELDYLRLLGASLQSAKEVKIFGLGPYLAQRYEEVSTRIYQENKAVALKRAGWGSVLNLVATGGYYGGYAVVLGHPGRRNFHRNLYFSHRILLPFQDLYRTHPAGFTEVSEQALFLRDLFEFFAMTPGIASARGALPAPRPITDGFEFRDVSFAYPGASRPVLRNVSFRLEPGQKLALIGENGAGKTTLVKLLARLYDPTAGQVLLDGVDLREYSVEDLRKEIGVIFQDYMRYDMLAKENIGFGEIDGLFDEDRIERAWPQEPG
jgi:ATP-binding cassette, subfamily B, bacterial